MSGDQDFPPPGSPPGAAPPPGWSPPPPPPPAPTWAPSTGGSPTPYPAGPPAGTAPGMLGAAHKPGAIALRPLGLGDIYDGAFRIIRFNPTATVGSAVLVAAVSMALPVLLVAGLTVAADLTPDGSADMSTGEMLATLGTAGALLLGSLLQGVGLLLVAGMIAQVVAAAAIGRRLTLGQAWSATRGSRWRLVGLTVVLSLISLLGVAAYVGLWVVLILLAPGWLIAVFAVLTLPAMLVLAVWWWVRVYYLAVPALMIERIGVFAAIGRSYRLTRRQFWRTFGIALLTLIVTSVAGGFLSAPFSIAAQVVPIAMPDSQYLPLIVVVLTSLGTVVQTAFVTPFSGAVASLQYLDQRMRKEAYDVELMAQAGLT